MPFVKSALVFFLAGVLALIIVAMPLLSAFSVATPADVVASNKSYILFAIGLVLLIAFGDRVRWP